MNVALVQAVCREVRINPTESLGVCGGVWNEIDGAENATCLAFNPWGTLLSVGEKEGLVMLWDFSTIPSIIRELNPKTIPSLPDIKQANSCAWSRNGRILAVACELKAPGRKGTILLWDIEHSTLIAAIACDSMATYIVFSPTSRSYSLLVSCANGELQTLSWEATANHTQSEVAPSPQFYYRADSFVRHVNIFAMDTISIFASICGDATVPQSTRNFNPLIMAKYGHNCIYCVSLKGAVAMLNPHTYELIAGLVLAPISSVDVFVDSTSLLVPSTKGVHEIELSSTSPFLVESRLYTAGAAVKAPWIMASKSPDGQFVLGIPQPRGLFVGEKGMFMWERRAKKPHDDEEEEDEEDGDRMYHDHRFSGDMVAVAWHPRRESLTVISSAGSVHVLEVQYASSWPGAMYPPGFTLINDNVIYEEPEDEFDVQPTTPAITNDPSIAVDIMTISDDDECNGDSLKYIPASPLTTWNHEAAAFEDDDVSSIFSSMKESIAAKAKKRKLGIK
ncbi:hypothetical protein LEN26_006811 [Aphanomyces euteiches]|nr:hypothetical protein AeMF1_020730 [Aphanomyces euteiches]KAH9134456.1 hypothetical protein LEN26_006811 [Aphanomyces euteiches]KAH9193195.1 hypothetical protein AeNC1_004833 [Aphanomyces euteiches]